LLLLLLLLAVLLPHARGRFWQQMLLLVALRLHPH
jgi:hypothetical protein